MRLNAGIEIPEGWQFLPLKRITRFGYGDALASDVREQGGVKVYGSNGAFDEHSEANTLGPCIIIGRKGSYGKLNYSNDPVFAVDTTFIVDRRHTGADLRFLYYLLGVLGLDELSDDTAVPGLSREKAYQALSPLPPLVNQRRIARFLDEKTARIDGLIEKKRALLDRLAEKRQALITRAVTKGLNTDAPMKPSGIDWLGDVPAHWETRKVKFAVGQVVDCLHTTPEYVGDLIYPAVRTADIDRGRLLLDQARLVSEEVYLERIQRLKPLAGDVLYSREGERFGMAAVVPESVDLCLGQRMMIFRTCQDVVPTYLMWALNSESIYEQVTLYAGGSTSPHVNIRDIINFVVPHPPTDEQLLIADHISESCDDIDRVTVVIRDSMRKLDEYRSALITAAITGQIPELR